jgi:hypothetical protein
VGSGPDGFSPWQRRRRSRSVGPCYFRSQRRSEREHIAILDDEWPNDTGFKIHSSSPLFRPDEERTASSYSTPVLLPAAVQPQLYITFPHRGHTGVLHRSPVVRRKRRSNNPCYKMRVERRRIMEKSLVSNIDLSRGCTREPVEVEETMASSKAILAEMWFQVVTVKKFKKAMMLQYVWLLRITRTPWSMQMKTPSSLGKKTQTWIVNYTSLFSQETNQTKKELILGKKERKQLVEQEENGRRRVELCAPSPANEWFEWRWMVQHMAVLLP